MEKQTNSGTVNISTYVPMDLFPLEHDDLPEGKKGWLIFLDEFNSADKYVLAAAYKLLLDRQVGEYHLHPNVRIVCAGNLITDGSIVNKMPTAIKSRMSHIQMELNPKEFLDYVEEQVAQNKWNGLILSFLRFRPDMINDFDPKKEVQTFSSPRTWEFLSKELNAGLLNLDPDVYSAAINGIIGEHAGSEFCSYLRVYNALPTIQEIVADPANCPLPAEVGARWALSSYLANNINAQTEKALITYAERIPEDSIQIICFRMMVAKYPPLVSNPHIQQTVRNICQKLIS